MDKTFTLYWLTGQKETVTGPDAATAMTLAGYSQGALGALDFYSSGNCNRYEWNAYERKWQWTEEYLRECMGETA